jgi:hypothetical protein
MVSRDINNNTSKESTVMMQETTTTKSRYHGAGVSWRPATDQVANTTNLTVEIGTLIRSYQSATHLLPILAELTRVSPREGARALERLLDMGFGGDEERGVVLDESPLDEIYEDDALEAIDGMMDALTDAAPEGIYFGGHPVTGVDFGYWPEPDRSGGLSSYPYHPDLY